MIERIITKHLEKKGFRVVPSNWLQDYLDVYKNNKEITSSNNSYKAAMSLLATQYNDLLKDYVGKLSKTEIKEQLKNAGETCPKDLQEAIDKYLDIYSVEIDLTTEEVLSIESNSSIAKQS